MRVVFGCALFGVVGSGEEGMAITGDSAVAKASFELANNIKSVASVDAVFRYDQGKQQELLVARPWDKE